MIPIPTFPSYHTNGELIRNRPIIEIEDFEDDRLQRQIARWRHLLKHPKIYPVVKATEWRPKNEYFY